MEAGQVQWQCRGTEGLILDPLRDQMWGVGRKKRIGKGDSSSVLEIVFLL